MDPSGKKKNVEFSLRVTRYMEISFNPFCKSSFCATVKRTWKFPWILFVKNLYRARVKNIYCTFTLGTRKYPWVLSVAKYLLYYILLQVHGNFHGPFWSRIF